MPAFVIRRRFLAIALTALALPAAHAAQLDQQRDGVTLSYRDSADALDATMRQRIVDTFFSSYARERADFNSASATTVTIVIDAGYDGIAYVGKDATITINPAWLKAHPADIDLVAHEAMHIVQAYAGDDETRVPGWLTEGIADYARDRYGVDNASGGWALPIEVKPEHRYDSGYRVTAAFLKWADAQHAGLVKALDAALRDGSYAPALWTRLTGKDVAALWRDYAAARAAAGKRA